MLKKILIAIVAIVVVFVVVVALQPAEYRVSRSAAISAPAADVFPLVNDFHKWERWSPWASIDPAMRVTYAGPAEGAGSVYTWTGNSKVGEGRMTITESRPHDLVRIRLEFIKPFASTSTTEFAFQPQAGGVATTWSMSGELGFIEKAMCMFVSMDKMIGPDFERGLAQLKSAAEKRS